MLKYTTQYLVVHAASQISQLQKPNSLLTVIMAAFLILLLSLCSSPSSSNSFLFAETFPIFLVHLHNYNSVTFSCQILCILDSETKLIEMLMVVVPSAMSREAR